EWERYRPEIRDMYLCQHKPLAELVEKMNKHGYSVTNSQMETRLKKWEYWRNLPKRHWQYLAPQIEKRTNAGKMTQVSLSGVVLDPAKVRKGCKR
ncbi:hypothetical protein QBC47DRAFT_272505, partial [Echria macrotheca]